MGLPINKSEDTQNQTSTEAVGNDRQTNNNNQ